MGFGLVEQVPGGPIGLGPGRAKARHLAPLSLATVFLVPQNSIPLTHFPAFLHELPCLLTIPCLPSLEVSYHVPLNSVC